MRQELTISAILASLFLVLPTAIASESGLSNTTEQEALAINHYAVGRYRTAIRLWKQLIKDNLNLKRDRFLEISILMASAQDSLGYPRSACSTLQKAIDADPYLCELDLNHANKASLEDLSLLSRNDVIAALTLANIIRDFGKFDQAQALLEFAAPYVAQLNDERLIAGTQLSLADLSFMKLKLLRDRVDYRQLQLSDTEMATIEASFTDAYRGYESAFGSPLHHDALSKWLQLHEEHHKFQPFINASSLLETKSKQYKPNLERLLSFDLSEATDAQKIQFNLDLGQRAYEFGVSQDDIATLKQSFEFTAEALQQSGDINNQDLLSKGYGQLGKLYLLSGQSDQALEAFDRASQYAQQINDVHRLYEWQHELAKLHKKQGDTAQAATHFEAAIATIRKVEWVISPLTSELRLNFQEQAAPVYQDYLEMLVNTEAPDYRKVLGVHRKFEASELQNYLGCGTLQPVSADQIFENDANAIVINIVKAGDQYHTIVESSDGSITQVQSIDVKDIEESLKQTRVLLDAIPTTPNRKSPALQYNLNQLYSQLIAPIENQLEPGKTLVFALDPSFQQVPVSTLFDGNQFLVEKYSVALIPPQMGQPTPVDSRTKDDVFFAGLSQARNIKGQEFSSLPNVETEAQVIKSDEKLLNKSFTQNRLIAQLAEDIPIFHIATHGQFSSDPKQTFILAWDDKITLNSLTSVVGYRAQNTPKPIELLVLSACETAKGDPLAALGLAGFTVQSGARSTLASLWRSDDLSSTLLMEDFYQFWRDGHSRAKALQLAQINQIKQGRSPYSWGNFVLVGSWL